MNTQFEAFERGLRERHRVSLVPWEGVVAAGLIVAGCLFVGHLADQLFGRHAEDPISTARSGAIRIQSAIEIHRAKRSGGCPADWVGLDAAGIVERIPKDPWGMAYRFECRRSLPVNVYSAGPDWLFGTDDDISSLDPDEDAGG